MPCLPGLHRIIAGLLVAALVWTSDAAAVCKLESPAHRATVLELYTSEGCSSCPPADRWLTRLRGQGADAKVLPLAFHVDYWNELGWVDRFSQPAFSARQRSVGARSRSRFVYTPQLVLDGQDWRRWRTEELDVRLRSINAERPGAAIRATAQVSGSHVELLGVATLAERNRSSPIVAWVALYEHDLATAVVAGENRGRTLQHDYVVRSLIGPLRAGADGSIALRERFTLGSGWKRERLGVAVFAENDLSGRVLQAVSATGCL